MDGQAKNPSVDGQATNKEQRTTNKEQGTKNKEQGTKNKEQRIRQWTDRQRTKNKHMNVLLFVEHQWLREAIETLLKRLGKFNNIEAINNDHCWLERMNNSLPDLLIVRIPYRFHDKVEHLRKMINQNRDLKVIALIDVQEEDYYRALILAGVKGIVCIQYLKESFLNAVFRVLNDECYFDDVKV